MSELKARHVVDVYDNYVEHPCEDYSQVYLKSEADKVIAHNKYKRCLAMAEICCEKKENCYNRALRKYSKDEADYLCRKSEFWQDWEFRWLELAEKFKPNKSTAQ